MTSPLTDAIPIELLSPEQSNHIRFVGLGVYIVLMIVDLWIIISLIHFGIKTKKWRRLQSGNPDLLWRKRYPSRLCDVKKEEFEGNVRL